MKENDVRRQQVQKKVGSKERRLNEVTTAAKNANGMQSEEANALKEVSTLSCIRLLQFHWGNERILSHLFLCFCSFHP